MATEVMANTSQVSHAPEEVPVAAERGPTDETESVSRDQVLARPTVGHLHK